MPNRHEVRSHHPRYKERYGQYLPRQLQVNNHHTSNWEISGESYHNFMHKGTCPYSESVHSVWIQGHVLIYEKTKILQKIESWDLLFNTYSKKSDPVRFVILLCKHQIRLTNIKFVKDKALMAMNMSKHHACLYINDCNVTYFNIIYYVF